MITAVNLAGESTPAQSSILVGQIPSAPVNFKVIGCVPNSKITVAWEPILDTGCIAIRSYIIALNGVDQTSLIITPDMKQADVDISSSGAYGTDATLSIKATNDVGTGYSSPTLLTTIGSVPNAPTALTVVSRPSNSSLVVSWTAETAIANNQPTIDYRIYDLGDNGYTLISDTGSGGLSLKTTLANLTTGDVYTLVIRAVNYWGESADSASLQVTIGTKPSSPSSPVLSTSTSTSITLTIKTSSDNGGVPISAYTVYYDEGQTGTYSSQVITDLSNLVWTQTGMSTSALVNVQVTSTNAIGESDMSNLVTFVVAGTPSAPVVPTQVGIPVVQSDGTISATISWTAPANQGSSIIGYTLYSKITQSSSDYAVVYSGLGRPEVLQYTVSNLAMSVQYNFQVTATNSAGEGSASPALSFIAAGAPGAPINLSVVSTSTGSITITWDPPVSDGGQYLTNYIIYYKTGSGSYSSKSVSSSTTLNTLSLTADVQYSIRVSAKNGVSEGLPSTSTYAYASSVPASLTTPTVITRDVNSLIIGWTSPISSIPITGYRVYMNKGDGSYPTILAYDGEVIPTKLYANISSLNLGSEYMFTFTAFNGAGESNPSSELTTLAGKYPDPPSYAPHLVSSTSSSIQFSWEPSAQSYGLPITKYNIYQGGTKIGSVLSSVYSYTISTGLTAGNSYLFSISSETEIGEGIQSYTATFYAVDLPSAPTLTVYNSTRDTCMISWNQVTPPANTVIQGYVVLINDGLGGDTYSIGYNGKLDSGQLTASITGLSARRTYQIVGYAINKAGNGPQSSVVT